MPEHSVHCGSYAEATIRFIKSQLASYGKCPELSLVSQQLNVSERTLRRYLQAEGCNFASLTETARYQLLRSLQGKTLEELAELLDYSEPRSVSRLLHKYKSTVMQNSPVFDA